MNLNSRLSKLETGQGLSTVSMVIVAEDQADFDRQFEDAFLAVLAPAACLSQERLRAFLSVERTSISWPLKIIWDCWHDAAVARQSA
jgi:hypothetical protein